MIMFLLLSFLCIFSSCFAYIINVTPSTSQPAPLDKISWEITPGGTDPTVVNILLTSASRGNTTIIATNTDLSKSSKGTFDIPFIPSGNYFLRLTSTSDTLLQDSSVFQIFATTSASSSLPATGASQSSTTTSSPTSQPVNEKKKSSAPIGAIVGGVVGGILAILVILALVHFFVRPLWALRTKKHVDDAEKSQLNPITKPHPPHSYTVEPYTVPPFTSGDKGPGDNERSDTFSAGPTSVSTSKFTTMSSKARLMQNTAFSVSQYNTADASSSQMTVPISDSASVPPGISRANYLRAERERINREIAMLEGASTAASTAGGSYGASSAYTPSTVPSSSPSSNRELEERVAMLNDQMRQIEARLAQPGHQDQFPEDVEPPPGYYPPPAGLSAVGPATTTPQEHEQSSGLVPRPASVQVRSPLVDVKGPIGE